MLFFFIVITSSHVLDFSSPIDPSSILDQYHLDGSTAITENSIVLTPDVFDKSGRMSSLTRLEGNRWVVNLDFNIHTKNKLLGDGIGVWFTETHIFKGEANGGPDRWSGLAILIDTYDNDKKKDNPLIIGIINDGTKIYNPDTDGLDIASGKCTFKDLVNDKNLVTTLTVIYDGNEDTIEVMIKNSKRTTNCFTISNVPLNNPYLSFSGKTGGVSETANLLKLEIEELTGEKSSIKEEKKKSPKKRNSNAGNKKEDEALIGLDLEELFGDKENEEDQVDYALKYLTEKIQMITNRVENIKELSSENNVDYEAVINYIKRYC
ncbi:vesicular integral-membrane protein VIP36 precursor [Entamoeba marina]